MHKLIILLACSMITNRIHVDVSKQTVVFSRS